MPQYSPHLRLILFPILQATWRAGIGDGLMCRSRQKGRGENRGLPHVRGQLSMLPRMRTPVPNPGRATRAAMKPTLMRTVMMPINVHHMSRYSVRCTSTSPPSIRISSRNARATSSLPSCFSEVIGDRDHACPVKTQTTGPSSPNS